MISFQLNKILSAFVMGILMALYIRTDFAKWGRLGKDAYLLYQGGRFDTYMASNHPRSISILATVIVATFAVFLYELVAMAIAKVLPSTHKMNQAG